MDDPARFASDFRVRSPARSAKVFLNIKNAASYKTMRQIGGPRGIRTLDLSDANRTLSHADLKEAPKGKNISLGKRQKI